MVLQLNCSNLTGHRRVGHVAAIGLKFGTWGFSRVLSSTVILFQPETAAELLELDGVTRPIDLATEGL